MSQIVGEGVVHVSMDDRDVARDASKVGAESGKRFSTGFGGAIKGLAAAAGAAFAGEKVFSFFKEGIQGASDLNETVSKTKVVFGDAAGQVLDFAKGGAAAFGQTQQQILDAAGTFGTFGKAAGLQGKALGGFSTQLSGLSSDLASFFNTDPTQAAEAIAAGLRGESEPLRQYGVLLDDATLKSRAMKLGLIDTTKDALTPQVKVLAAHAEILAQTKDAQGDFARTSGGLANQQRILAATFSDLRTKAGTLLLPVVLAVTKGLVGMLNGADKIGGVLSKVKDAISDLFSSDPDTSDTQRFAEIIDNLLGNSGRLIGPLRTVGDVLHTAQDALHSFLDAFHSGLSEGGGGGGISETTAQLGDLAHNALPQIVSFIKTQVVPVVKQLGEAFITNVVPVLKQASTTFRTVILPALVALISYVAKNVAPILLQAFNVIRTQILPLLSELALFIYGTVYPAVVQIVAAVAKQLKPVFDTLVQVLRDDILPTIDSLVQQIRTQLLPVLEPLIVKILKVVGVLLKVAAAILSVVLPPLLKLVGFLLKNLIPVIVGVIVVLVKIINKVFDFGGAVIDVISKFVRFNAEVIRLVKGAVEDVLKAITGLPGAIGDLGQKFFNVGKAIIGKFLDGLKNAGGAAKGIVSGIWDALKGLINRAIDGINADLEFRISVGFGKHISINPPDIPHLATGTRNFPGGLAVVGERGPELVSMPSGSRVFSNADSAALARSGELGGTHITIGQLVAHDYGDFTRQTHVLKLQAAVGGRRVGTLTGAA